MDLIVKASPAAVAQVVAATIAGQLARKPDSVLALAGGNTPLLAYAELARRHRAEGLSFARATVFTLDEYAGLSPDHPAAIQRAPADSLCRAVDLPPGSAHAPDGTAPDLAEACARYERLIAEAGGIDLVLLGIGANGHIAFNEPGSPPDSRTRVVTLTAETRAANQTAFGAEPVPPTAITIGIGTILSSRFCLLTAHGRNKASAITRTLEGPETTSVPASILRRHDHAVVCIDEEAAAQLSPAWRRGE